MGIVEYRGWILFLFEVPLGLSVREREQSHRHFIIGLYYVRALKKKKKGSDLSLYFWPFNIIGKKPRLPFEEDKGRNEGRTESAIECIEQVVISVVAYGTYQRIRLLRCNKIKFRGQVPIKKRSNDGVCNYLIKHHIYKRHIERDRKLCTSFLHCCISFKNWPSYISFWAVGVLFCFACVRFFPWNAH